MAADPGLINWLLDSDPALKWQVERDLAGAPPAQWERTRAMVRTEGFGAELLALQDPDGQWAGGAYFPADFDFEGPEAAADAGQPYTATTWSLNMLREWGLDAAALAGTAEKLAANSRWEYEDLPYWGGEVDCCINAFTLANDAWLGAARHRGEEYLLERKLLYRQSTRERVAPWVSHFAYPFRWFYSALHALDYFRAAALYDDAAPDPRLADAIEVVRSARQPDGTWIQERRHLGREWFEVDVPPGEPSKWLTFHATRVLDWWDGPAPAKA